MPLLEDPPRRQVQTEGWNRLVVPGVEDILIGAPHILDYAGLTGEEINLLDLPFSLSAYFGFIRPQPLIRCYVLTCCLPDSLVFTGKAWLKALCEYERGLKTQQQD